MGFWGHVGLENVEAKKILADSRIDYVMDKCMRVEHGRIATFH